MSTCLTATADTSNNCSFCWERSKELVFIILACYKELHCLKRQPGVLSAVIDISMTIYNRSLIFKISLVLIRCLRLNLNIVIELLLLSACNVKNTGQGECRFEVYSNVLTGNLFQNKLSVIGNYSIQNHKD